MSACYGKARFRERLPIGHEPAPARAAGDGTCRIGPERLPPGVPAVLAGPDVHRAVGRRMGDGHELGAWLVRGRDEAPSVLLLHGDGGSRRKCLDRAAMLAAE